MMQVLIDFFFNVMFVTYPQLKKKNGVFHLEEKYIKTLKQ